MAIVTSLEVTNNDPYLATSRYKGSKYYQRVIAGVGTYVEPEIWKAPEVPDAANDLYTEVLAGEEGRLDLVAMRIYRHDSLWWILALANNIIDPFEEVTAGMQVRYPQFSWVAANILS